MRARINCSAVAVGCLLIFARATSVTHAATETWLGNASANWSTGGWINGNNPPLAGDSLIFSVQGSAGVSLNNDLTSGLQINGIMFNIVASAFTIGGNSITLGGDITNGSSNPETLNFNITTTAVRTITTGSGGGNVTLGGAISGSGGGLTLAGPGTLTLSGSSANTYSGATTVNSGTLALNRSATNAVIVGSGLTINSGGTVQEYQNDQIGDSTPVTVNAGGTLQLNANVTDFLQSTTLGGGTISSSGSGYISTGPLMT